jgi:hypothetical protein
MTNHSRQFWYQVKTTDLLVVDCCYFQLNLPKPQYTYIQKQLQIQK